MLFIYRILINTILLFSPIILILRLIKKKEDPDRFKEKLGFFSKKKKIWKTNLVSWGKCWGNSKCTTFS